MAGFLLIVIALAFLALGPWVAMLLWNALMPDLFGLASIGYWQAAGLMVLARLLFGTPSVSTSSK